MGVGQVGSGHVAAGGDSRVEQDRGVDADRADEPDGSDLLGDLRRGGGTPGLAEGVGQLDLVDPVVAAHKDDYEAAVLGDHGERLEQGAGRDAERVGDLGDGARPGVSTGWGASSRSGRVTVWGSAVATSTLAA